MYIIEFISFREWRLMVPVTCHTVCMHVPPALLSQRQSIGFATSIPAVPNKRHPKCASRLGTCHSKAGNSV